MKKLGIVLFIYWCFDSCEGQACGSKLSGSGEIVSEGYPNTYPSYFDCTWIIEAHPQDTVNLRFDDFHIEPGETCEFDSVVITAAGASEKFCGDKISDIGNDGFLSLRGDVTIRMTTDDSIDLRGISLSYQVLVGEEPPVTTTPTPDVVVTTMAVQITTCDDEPCQNGGECLMMDETEFYCFCSDGFTGATCETNIDECQSNPCENGASCIDGIKSWSCNCLDGYHGETCAIDYNECLAEPCLNGGTCEDRLNAFDCVCVKGWTNWDCGTDIDECAAHPCQNHGFCEDHLGYYECICHPRFTGENCSTSVAESTETPSVITQPPVGQEDRSSTLQRTNTPTTKAYFSIEAITTPSPVQYSTVVPVENGMTEMPESQPEFGVSQSHGNVTHLPAARSKEVSTGAAEIPRSEISTKTPHNVTTPPHVPSNTTKNETDNKDIPASGEEAAFPVSAVVGASLAVSVLGVLGAVFRYCKSTNEAKKVKPMRHLHGT